MRNRKAPRLAYAGRLGDRLKAIERVPLGVFHNITRQRTLDRWPDAAGYIPISPVPSGRWVVLRTSDTRCTICSSSAVGPSVLAVGGLVLTTCHRRGRHDAE